MLFLATVTIKDPMNAVQKGNVHVWAIFTPDSTIIKAYFLN